MTSTKLSGPCPKCGKTELRLHEKRTGLTYMATCFSCRRTYYDSNGEWIETSASRRVDGSVSPSPVDRIAMRTAEKARKASEDANYGTVRRPKNTT